MTTKQKVAAIAGAVVVAGAVGYKLLSGPWGWCPPQPMPAGWYELNDMLPGCVPCANSPAVGGVTCNQQVNIIVCSKTPDSGTKRDCLDNCNTNADCCIGGCFHGPGGNINPGFCMPEFPMPGNGCTTPPLGPCVSVGQPDEGAAVKCCSGFAVNGICYFAKGDSCGFSWILPDGGFVFWQLPQWCQNSCGPLGTCN